MAVGAVPAVAGAGISAAGSAGGAAANAGAAAVSGGAATATDAALAAEAAPIAELASADPAAVADALPAIEVTALTDGGGKAVEVLLPAGAVQAELDAAKVLGFEDPARLSGVVGSARDAATRCPAAARRMAAVRDAHETG
jgi:hypothetical protein